LNAQIPRMINHLVTMIVMSLMACISQATHSDSAIAYPAELPPLRIIADSVKTDQGTLAFTAVDRQCGSCHHGDRSTNAGALAIFNLKDDYWYCTLTVEQSKSLKKRISGPSFTDEERDAILALIAHLSTENESTTH